MTTSNLTFPASEVLLIGDGPADFTIEPHVRECMYYITNTGSPPTVDKGIRLIGGQNESLRVVTGKSLYAKGEEGHTITAISTPLS